MNYKSLLLAGAAVMISGSAMAADLTNPFYQPGEGQILSTTSFETSRTEMKHNGGAWDGNSLTQEIEYGINNNWSINGSITNDFDTEGVYNNSHNFDYSLGASYVNQINNMILSAGVEYSTSNPKDYWGHRTPERWEKELSAELGLGYDMGNGLTPYVMYEIASDIDTADRELDQAVMAGIHKFGGNYAFDIAARYDFNTDGRNSNEWWGLASADYYLKDNIALGVYGEYYLGGNDGEDYNDIDESYVVGVQAKVLF